jgi:dethiobiotin synthetase
MDSITGIKTNVGKLQFSAGLAKAVALEYIRSINKHT